MIAYLSHIGEGISMIWRIKEDTGDLKFSTLTKEVGGYREFQISTTFFNFL